MCIFEQLTTVLEKFPKYTEAYLGRAQLYLQYQMWPQAMHDYKQVLQLSPECGIAHMGIADCLAAVGKREEAYASYTHAIELDKTLIELALKNRGHCEYKRGKYESALQDFNQVILCI